MTYIDGLKAAEELCAERSKQALREAAKWDPETGRTSCLTEALEALQCALAIKRLAEQAMREEATDG